MSREITGTRENQVFEFFPKIGIQFFRKEEPEKKVAKKKKYIYKPEINFRRNQWQKFLPL